MFNQKDISITELFFYAWNNAENTLNTATETQDSNVIEAKDIKRIPVILDTENLNKLR